MTIDHDNSVTDVINFKLIKPNSAAGIKYNSSGGALMGGYIHGERLTQMFRGSVLNAGINIDVNNNIGLGTSLPLAKLDIPNLSTNDNNPSLRLLHLSNGFNRLKFEILGKTGNFVIASKIESNASDSRLHLYSNEASSGNVLSITGDGDIIHEGFTKLGGASSPNIKMKKLTGVTPSNSSSLFANHGLTASKILDVSILIETPTSLLGFYPPNSGSTKYAFRINVDSIFIFEIPSFLRGQAYKVLITYED